MTKILIIFLLAISFFQCGKTNEPVTKEYLKGIWRGTLNGEFETFVNFKNDNRVEILSCMGSDREPSNRQYELYRENDKVALKIEGIRELLYPQKEELGKLGFGVSEADSRQVVISTIALIDFQRAEQMSCDQ